MSTQNKLAKLITRFEIGFDNETKADIDALKDKLDEVTRALSVKNDSHGDRLLAAMQAEAANDAPQPDLKKMGQWVFEGQDEKWVSAAKDADNEVWLFQVLLKDLATNENKDYSLWYAQDGSKARCLCDLRSSEDWKNSAIDRETVNDVDYLSESVPEIQGMDAREITQADMQLIFIKNLSECLTQRMHSMDRFSEDDNPIGGAELTPWDIVLDRGAKAFGVITNTHTDSTVSAVFFPKRECGLGNNNFHITSLKGKVTQTITEAQLTEFRAALEACYA